MTTNTSQSLEAALVAVGHLQKKGIFAEFDDAEMMYVAQHMGVHRAATNTYLCREGETGDALYVLLEGRCEMSSRDSHGRDIPVCTFGPGTVFGEQAILAPAATGRTATIRTVEDCRYARLPHTDFLEMLDDETRAALLRAGAQQAIDRLRAVSDIFSRLPFDAAAARAQIIHLNESAVIFQEEDPSDRAYFVVNGRVSIRRGGSAGWPIADLGPGQLFGEVGVLEGRPRTATALAISPVTLLAVPWSAFRKLHEASPEFRELTSTLWRSYALAGGRSVTFTEGRIGPAPAVCALFVLSDGRTALTTRAVGSDACAVVIANAAAEQSFVWMGPNGMHREIALRDGKLVSLMVLGPWAGLGAACARILDGRPLTSAETHNFHRTGDFDAPDGEASAARPARIGAIPDVTTICPCLGTTAADIRALARDGARDAASIAQHLGAGAACGGCRSTITALVQEPGP